MRGLEVDDQFEFRRLLDEEVGEIGAPRILSTKVVARRQSGIGETRVVYGVIVPPSSSITR